MGADSRQPMWEPAIRLPLAEFAYHFSNDLNNQPANRESESRQPSTESQQLVGERLTHYSSILPFITQSNDWNP